MRSSADVQKETGLSRERINQVGRQIGVMKIAQTYVWTDEQIEYLKTRTGKRGDRLNAK